MKPKRSPWWGVQRFVVCMGILGAFWLIFGQIVPRVAFKDQPTAIAPEPVAEPSAEIIEDTPPPAEEPAVDMPQAIAEAPPAPPAPVEAPPPPPAVDDARLIALEEKITAQEQEITALKTALQAQATHTQAKVESTLSALIVFGQLKEAITRGESYAAPLAQLKALTLHNPQAQSALAALSAHAEKGVATTTKLSAQFAPLIKDALLVKADSRYARSLGKLFSIRKAGEQTGTDDEAVFARAESQLARDDVKTTLDTLAQLSPPVKDAVKPWMESAQQLLDARAQLDALQLALAQDKASE